MRTISAIAKRTASMFGLEIRRKLIPTNSDGSSLYERIVPHATYSPWNEDLEFNSTYNEISAYTLVDKYRCFELWKLLEQSAKLPSGAIIEIGVWRGGTGALIAKQASRCGILDTVYLCDTFKGVVKAGPKDSDYKGGEHNDTSRQLVSDLVSNNLRLANVQILEGVFPDETGNEIENLQFRFCHIDVDVYESAKDIVGWIWQKMVSGGILIFDDYGFEGCDGIAKYVDEQFLDKDRLVIHNLNGHAIIIKI